MVLLNGKQFIWYQETLIFTNFKGNVKSDGRLFQVYPVDTERKLNVHKTFNLRLVSTG